MMKKTMAALTLTSVLAFAQAAWAGGNEEGYGKDHGGKPPVTQPTPTTNTNLQGQNQGQAQGQIQGQNQGQTQNATGIGIGTGIASSTSGAVAGSNATAATGPITNTNGASATTGPIKNDSSATALGGTSSSTALGGASNATGGVSNASTGAVNVAPQQSTVNNFRSFVGTNAPNLSGSVDNCLAVLGWSAAVNVFGATGIGLGGGNQRTEYVEQCAAVKSAFEVWNRANGDINKETFALDLLIKALPTYGKPAMEAAVGRINTYIEQNGDAQPDSVMNIFGAKSFRKKEVEVAAAPVAAPAAAAVAPNNVTVIVNPVVEHKETRVIVAAKKKVDQPVKKPDCGCKQ